MITLYGNYATIEPLTMDLRRSLLAIDIIVISEIDSGSGDNLKRELLLILNKAGTDRDSIDDFFSAPNLCTGIEPYEAFEKWAVEHGYDLNDDEQRAAAIEAY